MFFFQFMDFFCTIFFFFCFLFIVKILDTQKKKCQYYLLNQCFHLFILRCLCTLYNTNNNLKNYKTTRQKQIVIMKKKKKMSKKTENIKNYFCPRKNYVNKNVKSLFSFHRRKFFSFFFIFVCCFNDTNNGYNNNNKQ